MNDTDLHTNTPSSAHSGREVFSVSDLNRRAKQLLEIHLPLIWVEGEISNFSRPASGHWYFTLKDDKAQVRCAMFRNRNNLIRKPPKTGDQVQMRARVSLYEGRGEYQLIAEHLEEAGFGILQKRFQELKQKLEDRGLFDPAIKKPLPELPQHIAVVTSPTGAAIRDVLSVLQRRFAGIPVTIIPAMVQGEGSIDQLCQAVKLADTNDKFDVILVCRGGGSIEDLWSFNSEKLANVIAEAVTPIVSAVGHEVDFTIADFVADLRAPTPSAAAELLSPDAAEISQSFANLERHLKSSMQATLKHYSTRFAHARKLLRHPGEKLNTWAQQLDQLEIRLTQAMNAVFNHKHQRLANTEHRIEKRNPRTSLELLANKTTELHHRLNRAISQKLKDKQNSLAKTISQLDIVSPLNTLKRGYAICLDDQGNAIRKSTDTKSGSKLEIRLGEGKLSAVVDDIYGTTD